MENTNNSWDFTDKVSDETDKIVNKFLDEDFVSKFTNLEIVQTFFKNGMFLKLNSWFEKNIKIISQVIWWISIVAWILMLFSPLNLFLGIFWFFSITFFMYILLSAVWWLVIAVFTFINGIWLIRMKKWVSFSAVVLFLVSNWINIITQIFSFTLPYNWYFYQYWKSFFWVLLWLALSLFISFTCTCLILKNKEKFDK